MKAFKHTLNESKNFNNAGRVGVKHMTPTGSQRKRFLQAIDILNKGLQNKEIYNAEFKDAYSYGLSRGLESAYSKLIDANRSKLAADNYKDDYDGLFNIQAIKKAHKHWMSKKKDYPELAQFMDAIKDVPDLVKEVKKYIIKGRKPSAAAIEREKEIASFDPRTKDKLHELFVGIGNSLKKDYYDYVYKTMELAVVKEKKNIVGKTSSKVFWTRTGSMSNHQFLHLLRKVYVPDSKGFSARTTDPLILTPKWRDTVKKEAEYATEMFLNAFVDKNANKLNGILKNREIESLKHSISKRDLTGTLIVKMTDKSEFTMTFNVITKVSINGKWFNQFPTRFTNVKKADGSKLATPSELKMKKEF